MQCRAKLINRGESIRLVRADESYRNRLRVICVGSLRHTRSHAGFMDHRTRMWKTLGCLAAAMSGTAALLGWMNPTRPHSAVILGPDKIVRLAQKAVSDGGVIRGDRWVDVEVAPAPARIAQERMLAATGASSTWHFLVDRYGRPASSRDWRAQKPAPDAPGAVRVLVVRPDGEQAMSAAQWLCVRTLAAALNDPARSDETSLPIRLHDGLARTNGAPARD